MKKMLALLLTLCLLAGLVPLSAGAAKDTSCGGGIECTHEAAIGDTHYDTIGEAIDAANKTSGSGTTTVQLLKDAALGLDYTKQKAIMKNMTLDLGGHTLKYAGFFGFTVNYNVTFTIQNGTYENTNAEGTGIQASKQSYTGPGCTIIIAEDATVKAHDGIVTVGHTDLTVKGKIISNNIAVFGMGPQNNVMLNGATIEAGVYGVYQQSKDGGSTYTIKNSTITTPSEGATCAVFISNNKASAEDTEEQGMQTLIIENSVISGQDGIEVMYTNVTISGEDTEVTAAEDGHALGVTYYQGEGEAAVGTLKIEDGTFEGDIGFMEGEANTATLTISGGTFTDDVSEYIQSGMTQDENGEIVETVATFNENNYGTLTAAINAANGTTNGGIVTLVADGELTTKMEADVTLVVGDDAELSVATSGLGNLATGTLEIEAGGGLMFDRDKLVGSTDSALSLTKGSVTMQGGTVTLTENSVAEIPNGETFYLMLGKQGPALNAVIEQGATLTVAEGGTLKAVSGSGESGSQVTVKGTLDVKGTLAIALKGKVTVERGGTLKLPAMTKETMGSSDAGKGMKGDIIVNSGANLTYADNDVLGGSAPLMNLTEGSATLNLGNANATEPSVSLTLNGNASVTGQTKALLVASNGSGTENIPLAISVAAGSNATVDNGGVLNLVNDSSLTVADDATFTVDEGGILEVHSTATFDDKATVSGKVYVFDANGGTNPMDGANITLTSTGAVYAEKTELSGTTITPAQMTVSTEEYTSTSSNVGEKTFAKQWTFSYKITLNANGGTLAGGTSELWTGTNGKLTAMPSNPTYSGYTFNGWYDAKTGGSQVNTNTEFTKNTTIYAQWSKKSSGTVTPTPPRPTEEKHSITISTDGKGQVTGPASAAKDDKVTLTVKPNADKKLYDLKVTDEDGKAIAVTKVNDTTYTFTMPDGKVTVAATFGCDGGDNCPSKAFTDLGDKQWYHDSIDYAVENGLLEGTSPTTMEPNATLIRAQLAQILYNIEDKPAVTGEMVFEDVPASEWFYSPVLWANQNDIINGTSPITFEPLEDISRQDLALMLYRYAGKPAVTGDLDGFTDADQVGDWAEEAMAWAVAEGIVQGDTPTTLNPTGTATRAEAAAMLQRFLENAA